MILHYKLGVTACQPYVILFMWKLLHIKYDVRYGMSHYEYKVVNYINKHVKYNALRCLLQVQQRVEADAERDVCGGERLQVSSDPGGIKAAALQDLADQKRRGPA